MGYKTKVVPDEDMEMHTEQSLDDKFKPEATWTIFQKDNLETKGTLDEGTLKIKTIKKCEPPFKDISVLIYATAEAMGTFKEGDNVKVASYLQGLIVNQFGFPTRDGINFFYDCNKCVGYVEGRLKVEKYDDIKGLAGTAGFEYKCERCGETLDKRAHMYS